MELFSLCYHSFSDNKHFLFGLVLVTGALTWTSAAADRCFQQTSFDKPTLHNLLSKTDKHMWRLTGLMVVKEHL